MKKLVVAILAMMLCFAFVGCGSASYTSEGDVTLQNGDGDKCNIQIAEIQKEDDSTTVYIRGTEDFMVSSYTMQSSGFGWNVTVGVKMTDAEGNQVEPVKTTPYMTGKGTGGAVSFTFEGLDYTDMFVYLTSNEEGGIAIPLSELDLPEENKMSDSIVELQ